MKKLIKYLFIIVLTIVLPCKVFAAGSLTTSTKNLTITEGSSASFNIKASNAVGRVDISSSNTSIATVSTSNVWIENQSVSVKVKGKKVGTTTIVVKKTDVATFDGEELTGNIVINVKVVEKKVTPQKPTTPTKVEEEIKPVEVKHSDEYNIVELGVKKVESSLLKTDYETVLEMVNSLKEETEKKELLDRMNVVLSKLNDNTKCETECVCETCKSVNCTLWIILCFVILILSIGENLFLYFNKRNKY